MPFAMEAASVRAGVAGCRESVRAGTKGLVLTQNPKEKVLGKKEASQSSRLCSECWARAV